VATVAAEQTFEARGSRRLDSPAEDWRGIRGEGPSAGQAATRALNVGVAAVAIVLTAPVMAAVALAVRLTSPGPVLYTQPRVGIDRRARRDDRTDSRRSTDLGGQVFRIYKFRTMRVDAEQGSGAVWATRKDSRVTPIGEFLRKSRLDELPQLFNVLLGDMNVVGPRPERPSIFRQLSREIDGYSERQRTRPGITGWAQINQAYDTCVDDVRKKVAYDLEYLERRTLLEDLKIMVMTVPVMIGRKLGW
jgi:lipopolysaccharide/colanic/teichoic acid biosynthesis glycosyltransferase